MGHIAIRSAVRKWRCLIARVAGAAVLILGGGLLIAGYQPAEEFLRCIVP